MIRTATIKDYNQINEIMNQVQALHVNFRPDIYQPATNFLEEEELQNLIDENLIYVSELDGSVVGVLIIMFRHIDALTHVTRDVIFVDTMAVDEKYRGRGIGHEFFEFLKELKREKNLDAIELQVNARNEKAYKMYLDYGFTNKSINMELL